MQCRVNITIITDMKYVFIAFGIFFGLLGLAVTVKDITSPDQPWYVVGQIWFEWAPSSLQISEAVVSRYIDPCGLIVALECSPFLWHPGVSTVLNWYAVPVFFLLALIFSVLGRWLGKRKKGGKVKA